MDQQQTVRGDNGGVSGRDGAPAGAQPVRVRVAIDVTLPSQRNVSARIEIEAQAEDAAQVANAMAAAVSAAVTSALASAGVASSALPPQASTAVQAQAVQSPSIQEVPAPGAAAPAEPMPAVPAMSAPDVPASAAMDAAPAAKRGPALWVERQRSRISAGFGVLLIALALLVPLVTPPEQRGETVIMIVLFGLTGALSLYSALTPGDGRKTTAGRVPGNASAAPMRAAPPMRPAAVAGRIPHNLRRDNRPRAITGMAFGTLLILAGLFGPFLLSGSESNPDTRFLMMLGFSPVVLSGGLLVAVFWRQLRGNERIRTAQRAQRVVDAGAGHSTAPDSLSRNLAVVSVITGITLIVVAVALPLVLIGAARAEFASASAAVAALGTTLTVLGGLTFWAKRMALPPSHTQSQPPPAPVRRAPVPRVPGGILYRVIVPATIVLVAVLVIAVIVVVIAATITPLVR
jgi:hypothetical protein